MERNYLILCLLMALTLTVVEITGSKDIPKQMKRLYKQYKRGDSLGENINTVRYIQAHKGSITSSKNLIYNLDSFYKEDEQLIRAELHYYRRSVEEMQTIQIDVSELSPYYITLSQRERRSPVGKGWQQMDITKTVRQCTNTVNTYNQVGISFSVVNADTVAVPVDMPTFLRHHSVPFILIYSENNRTLETDQISARSGKNYKDMIDELNSIIDPATGKSSKRIKRSMIDNRIDLLSPMSNEIPPLNQYINVDDLYNELTNEVEIKKPKLKEIQQQLQQEEQTTASDSGSLEVTAKVDEELNTVVQYIPWPSPMDKKKRKKSKSLDLLPTKKWKNHESAPMPNPERGCSRKSMRINFEDVGWGKRMIEPKKFDAHYCAGECNFPNSLGKHMTNHATLQSLLTSIRTRSDVPQPCCVPSKLQPVTLMYYDEHNNIVLKQYPDMAVESCACR